MTLAAALLLVAAVVTRRSGSRGRLPARALPTTAGTTRPGMRRRAGVLVMCLSAPLLLLVSVRGVVVMLVVAAALLARRALPRRRHEQDDAALTFDVLAACVDAGATPAAAAKAAADTASDGVRRALVGVATALERGDDPVDAWRRVAASNSALAPASRAFGRTAVTGAAVADELRRAAATARASHVAEGRRRVQRASVWLVLPLGLCFLPAFVLVGVAPIVAAAVPGLSR